ncbi:toll/interleukin-1 receptor domain-containing protein [Pseudarthrobacter sp. DSP2-3-2b1]|uniref:toll/interleukin-1 receptor domain-containing protein n=1 Tax=Pseudarthrobacter sp. DSP2-3-2b1 TaxID=2804661 RepID=UPI003CE92417
MRVFISWSGPKSQLVAAALHEWLDGPLNQIQTFMSQEDIAAGEDWSATIDDGLNNALFGIICTTPENQAEPWLNYEAGAIAKAVNGVQSRVVPLLIDFSDPTELVGPLKKFQAKKADQEGIFSVVRSINSALRIYAWLVCLIR